MNTAPAMREALRSIGYSANRIGPHLYIGAKPPTGLAFAALDFDLLVLCAMEHQPDPLHFPSSLSRTLRTGEPWARVLSCPLNDDGSPMLESEWERAQAMAYEVAGAVARGERVLVTCQMGINRSALVTALALRLLSGRSGSFCLEHVQRARPGALQNRSFCAALRSLGPIAAA